MKHTLLTIAAISLLASATSPALAQSTQPDHAQIRLHAAAAMLLAQHWLDWRHDGPENGGICVIGNVETDSTGAQVSNIRSVTRVARLSGCSSERTIGAAVFAPTELFDRTQLAELACAVVKQREDWVIFGIINGAERKLVETGQVLTVAQGLWCMSVEEKPGSSLAVLE